MEMHVFWYDGLTVDLQGVEEEEEETLFNHNYI